jgi:hypothetical protein
MMQDRDWALPTTSGRRSNLLLYHLLREKSAGRISEQEYQRQADQLRQTSRSRFNQQLDQLRTGGVERVRVRSPWDDIPSPWDNLRSPWDNLQFLLGRQR